MDPIVLKVPAAFPMVTLVGPGDTNLRILENHFPQLAITVRGNEIYVKGEIEQSKQFVGLVEELIAILHSYKEADITSILALRGDPTGGPRAPWTPTPNGLSHADELVTLAAEFGGFTIGVAAFPDGHPASEGDFERDIEVLLEKERLGATFATTQFFFEASKWISLVDKLKARGSKLIVIPGILPVTNVKQLARMAELSGVPIPQPMTDAFAAVEEDSEKVRALGVELATQLCQELIAAGAPGLHFYTMNTSTATREIYERIATR